MIWVNTNSKDACYNFAVEYYFASVKKIEEPIFILWQTRPTLMVGRYQNVYEEIDVSYVKSANYDIVRRMSGGGTIYTDEHAYQYSIIAPKENSEIDFLKYMSPMIQALRAKGINAIFNDRNDLLVNQKKISGTAQYHVEGYVVHHGSILYDVDIEEMERCITVDLEKIYSKGIKSVKSRVTNISKYMGIYQNIEMFMDDLQTLILGNKARQYKLNKDDITEIERIAEDKFRHWEWNFGQSPKCDLVKQLRLEGGKVEFHLSIKEGRISNCRIAGDFFSGRNMELLEVCLIGCRFVKEEVKACFEKNDVESYFYRMTSEALLKTLFD